MRNAPGGRGSDNGATSCSNRWGGAAAAGYRASLDARCVRPTCSCDWTVEYREAAVSRTPPSAGCSSSRDWSDRPALEAAADPTAAWRADVLDSRRPAARRDRARSVRRHRDLFDSEVAAQVFVAEVVTRSVSETQRYRWASLVMMGFPLPDCQRLTAAGGRHRRPACPASAGSTVRVSTQWRPPDGTRWASVRRGRANA